MTDEGAPTKRAYDIAAGTQQVYEMILVDILEKAKLYTHHKHNLVLMGGCALNCVANSKIKGKNIWIMPSPGDAGSSLGASALKQGKINWKHPYLGHDINRHINPKEVVDDLLEN